MSRKSKNFLLVAVPMVMMTSAVSAFLITRVSSESPSPNTHVLAQRPTNRGPRNLFLRPEALSVARRLGKRFNPSSRAVVTTIGHLIMAEGQHPFTLIRRQTDTGEQVELLQNNRGLTWSDRDGVRAASGTATTDERLLVERLTLDSADQFVLAQLRGCSYFTVARNVRPTEASDGYTGPLWNLVRVDEPQVEENLLPLSRWRIYYINVQTGLPDAIEYQWNDKQIRVDFVEWIERQGEKTPSLIRWSSDGQTIMTFRVSDISLGQ